MATNEEDRVDVRYIGGPYDGAVHAHPAAFAVDGAPFELPSPAEPDGPLLQYTLRFEGDEWVARYDESRQAARDALLRGASAQEVNELAIEQVGESIRERAEQLEGFLAQLEAGGSLDAGIVEEARESLPRTIELLIRVIESEAGKLRMALGPHARTTAQTARSFEWQARSLRNHALALENLARTVRLLEGADPPP